MEIESTVLSAQVSENSDLLSEITRFVGLDQSVVDFLNVGGPVIWVLSALSVLSLAIVLLKCWQFSQLRFESHTSIAASLELWSQGDRKNAKSLLNSRFPLQAMVGYAMQGIENKVEESKLQRELARQANLIHHQSKLYLKPLEVIASLSPLLGLMGTVLGMIEAFQQMQAAGSRVDPSILSGGIWQALLTTAAGLAVAIPVAAAHSWFDRKSERVAHLINDTIAQVFTRVPEAEPTVLIDAEAINSNAA